ncbi:MAG: outer membrane beta-barrel protein [Betaproteobacteria bacterium]|nr:outer membrane beta-barrel protein [Betaproteobacteria bacterium]
MKIKNVLPLALALISVKAFGAGLYVLGEVTHSNDTLSTAHADHALAQAGATGIASSTSGSSNQWRLQLGYRFNRHFAVEGGYIDFGKANYSATYAGGSANGTVKAGGVDVAALGFVPLTKNFSVFGKAGLVAARVTDDLGASAPAAAAADHTSATAVRPLFGVGATYRVSRTVDIRADLDHAANLGKSGRTDSLTSTMFSLGVAYKF